MFKGSRTLLHIRIVQGLSIHIIDYIQVSLQSGNCSHLSCKLCWAVVLLRSLQREFLFPHQLEVLVLTLLARRVLNQAVSSRVQQLILDMIVHLVQLLPYPVHHGIVRYIVKMEWYHLLSLDVICWLIKVICLCITYVAFKIYWYEISLTCIVISRSALFALSTLRTWLSAVDIRWGLFVCG